MRQGKGIVVEMAAKDHVIIMTSRGEFLRVPFDKPVHVGQEIHYTIKRPPFYLKWSIAAVLLLALVGSAGQISEIPGGEVPAYFVTLDINPSIELAVNAGQRVVAAEGLNQDGIELVGKMDLCGRTLKQAVQSIEHQAGLAGYLKPGQNEIVVTVSQNGIQDYEQVALGQAEAAESNLEQDIEAVIQETLGTVYHVQMWRVPTDARDKVREAGLTPAKYIAIHVDMNQSISGINDQNSTAVKATIERDGNQHSFEFNVTRPVFSSVTLVNTNSKE